MFRRMFDLNDIRDWFADFQFSSKKAALILALPFILFSAVFIIEYKIDDDLTMAINPKFEIPGGSRAVAMAATVMDRQINHVEWAANKPWIYPVAWSDDMQNYQIGIQHAVARWANEMSDTMGKSASGDMDKDLSTAAGHLKYDPTALVMPSAVSKYNDGIDGLMSYNRRLAHGQAHYDLLPSRLASLLEKISSDLWDQSAIIELMVLTPDDLTDTEKNHLSDAQRKILSGNGGYFDSKADDVFFHTKGRMYAYYMILKAVGEDYRSVIEAKRLTGQWEAMLISLRSGAGLYNFSVANGSNMSWVVPSHLSNIGFFLGRSDKQIREVANLLNK